MTSTTVGDANPSVTSIAQNYDGSIVFRRWLGAWIDFVILLSFLLVPDYVLGNETYRATLAVWVGLLLAYFPVTEVLLGRTVGKFVARTRVVNAQGRKPSFVQALVRSLFRLIEVNPLLVGGAPAGIAILVSKHRQRIGDMAAGTYVVLEKDARRIGASGSVNRSLDPDPLRGPA